MARANLCLMASIALVFLFLTRYAPDASAITMNVSTSSAFTTLSTNTTYRFGANTTVNAINVTASFINVTNSSLGDFVMYAMPLPSPSSLNVTIIQINSTYKKFNITNGTAGITVNFSVGNVTPNAGIVISKNGGAFKTARSNSTGFFDFVYDGGFSTVMLEASVDTTVPIITVQSPSNSTYTASSVWANMTLDKAGSVVLRSLDGGANVSLANSSGNWNSLMSGLSSGSHNVKFYANDTVGNNANPVTVFFTYKPYAIRPGSSCNAGETCVLSMWDTTNSHAGMCGYYSNYTLCTSELTSAAIRSSSCNAGEGNILNFYQQNDTHVQLSNGSYTYRLCSSPQKTCTLRGSCNSGESPMLSMNATTNSHIAQTGYFSNTLCCQTDATPPTISGEAINATSIKTGQPFRITANVTDDFFVSSVVATIRYPSGTKTNFTMNLLSGNTYYYDFTGASQIGAYTWTDAYASDSAGNWAHSTPNLQASTQVCYLVSGNAYDYLTGLPIGNGTATAISKETGERNSANFTGGSYSLCLYSSVDASANSFTATVITNSSEGKTGWNTLVVGRGPLAAQTQTCSIRDLYFSGYAVGTSGPIGRGTVSVRVDAEKGTYTNSTAFYSGTWGIRISPCLLSGGLYTFGFTLAGEGKRSALSMRQAAT